MSYREALKFVTLEDILGGQEEMNWVVYNPALSKTDNEKILKHVTKLKFDITLTADELDALTIFDKLHLYEFIEAYRETLRRCWSKPTL